MNQQPQPAQENKMGVMPVHRLLLTMSGPMMLSMLIQALYNVVDSMFVSYISEAALTAVSLAYPMQNLMIAVATGTGVGINALLSRNLGEKNFVMANRTAGNAIFLGLVSYGVFALLGVFGSRLYFTAQVEDPEIIALGCDYLSIILVLSIGCFGQVLLSRLLQSTGKTFYSMVIQMVGAGLNIVLDPIMIFGLMGFPRMGVAGAALATVLSQMVGTGMGLYYNLRKNPEIRLSLSGLRPSKPVIARIYGVGIPSILLQTVSSLLIFGLNQILVTFSETATAVYGVYFKLQGFAFLPIIGMNNGMVPIISYNYGAGLMRRGRDAFAMALGTAFVCGLAVFGFTWLFSPWIVGLFLTPDAPAYAIAVRGLPLFAAGYPFFGINVVTIGYYQSIERGRLATGLTVLRGIVLMAFCFLVLPRLAGVAGIWLAVPAAELAVTLLLLVLLRIGYGMRR